MNSFTCLSVGVIVMISATRLSIWNPQGLISFQIKSILQNN